MFYDIRAIAVCFAEFNTCYETEAGVLSKLVGAGVACPQLIGHGMARQFVWLL